MKSGVSAAWLALLLSLLIGLPRDAGAGETARSGNGWTGSATSGSRAAGVPFPPADAAGCPSSNRGGFRRAGEGRRSFTAPTVESVRTTGRNYLYKASFTPAAPPATFWEGHLEAFSIHEDGTVTARWDAGDRLRRTRPADRLLFAGHTADGLSWSRMEFHKDTITPGMLAVPTAAERDAVVDYVRGLGHDDSAKLGDVLHSKAVVVGPPSRFFFDEGYSTGVPAGEKSFADAKATRKRVVYVGTNDGMLHAFLGGTYDPTTGLYDAGTGEEMFGYVPFHILQDLVDYVPGEHTSHRYYVDSSPRAADVWIDANGDGTKQSSEWRTVLIGGLRGGGDAYFALDVTDPPSGTDYGDYPRVLWEYRNPSVVGET
ncbi:MAG TPA: PilC/PilY family type IV pilus protein, partial [Candidatus Aquicultoraceae bacterium]|nr:PilC/PilY family type IV pilus protein [Candidatus Aquicultoraceae bacterium]